MADLTGPVEPSLNEHTKVTAAKSPRKVSEKMFIGRIWIRKGSPL